MKKTILKKILTLAMVLAGVVMTAGYSTAADITVNLAAVEAPWAPPGGSAIPMWGFIQVTDANDPTSCPENPLDWDVGPRISAIAGDNLTINLRNCLSEEVSVFIPGQSKTMTPVAVPDDPQRIRSFDAETGLGAVGTYTWTNLKEGTYIYHSGTNLSKQVHMGLYGALIVNAGNGIAYNGAGPVNYDNDVVLFFSEIDPALHNPTPVAANPNNYKPRYFLVNGQIYPNAAPILDHSLGTNERVLVRMISAALDDLVPTISGLHWDIIAEDGNPYPYPKKQVTALLSPMKTLDAILVADTEGTYPVFDRRFNITNNGSGAGGMLVLLQAQSTAGAPVANPDSASVAEGDTVSVLESGETSVLANDNPSASTEVAAILVDNVIRGTLVFNVDGTFSYTHDGSESTQDYFTYKTSNGKLESNVATVTITITPVNDAPVAVNDFFEVVEGDTLTVAAPGVLGNDSDPEGNPLTAALDGTPPAGLTFNVDGSFSYTPAAGAGSIVTFNYVANDGSLNSEPATVTITVTAAPEENNPPEANNDFATTKRITGNTITTVTIHVTANDTDPDGNLDPTTVFVTNEELTTDGWVAISTRGGKVTNLKTGYVIYEPRRGFQGTDTFTYNVRDTEGAVSNQATVQVNVVK